MSESYHYLKISHSDVLEIVGLLAALLIVYEPISCNDERFEKLKDLISIFEVFIHE